MTPALSERYRGSLLGPFASLTRDRLPRPLNQTSGAKLSKSPNGIHSVEKILEGGIRFGPEYFRLRIDGRDVPNKIFGHPMAWSNDSRFLAVQEWLTEGPIK